MKIRVISLAVLFTLLVSSSVFAQGKADNKQQGNRPGQGPKMMVGPKQHMGMDCDLTDAQKTSFKKIQIDCFKATSPLENQLRELKVHQHTLVSEANPDLKAINSNIDKITDLQAKIQKIKVKAQVDMWVQLTDEQRMQMQEKEMNHGPQKGGHGAPMEGHQNQFKGPQQPQQGQPDQQSLSDLGGEMSWDLEML